MCSRQHLELIDERTQFQVMIAGLPRIGKSTSLNNIFGLTLPARGSARTVTTSLISTSVVRHGVSLTIIDAPGLGAGDISTPTILKHMKKLGDNVILVLTLSVCPNSTLTQPYLSMLKELSCIWGPIIWERTVIVLTFTDLALFEFEYNQQDYQDYLMSHCTVLEKALKSISVTKPVKLFFEYTSYDQYKNEKLDGIVAIPVAKHEDFPTEKLFPQQHWSHEYKWTDLAFWEIVKLTNKQHQISQSKCFIF